MPMIVSELYQALLEAGVGETLARDAARAVLGADARTDLATKADLTELRLATQADIAGLRIAARADLYEMEAKIIKWNVGTLMALTAIFAAIERFVP